MRIFMRRQAKCSPPELCGRMMISMLLLALVAVAATAAEPEPPAAAATQEEAVNTAPATTNGLLVAVDPVTGKLRAPTAAEAKALAATLGLTLKNAGQEPVEVVWPDGTVTVDLDESFLSFSVASIGSDGNVAMECFDHPAHVDHPVATTAAPAPLEEK